MSCTILEKVLDYSDIMDIYKSGCKADKDLKIGVEYERLPISLKTGKHVPYLGEYGVCNLLRTFAKLENWDYILDGREIIGLKQGHNTVTLEPGCQVEFSLEPVKSLDKLKSNVENMNKLINPIVKDLGISLLNYGVSPVSTYKHIELIPKKRYHIMAKYLWGILSDVMMRETAGIQGTFDFLSEEDALRKFKIANILSPFLTAMSANSPIRGGVDTGYKSFRALSWLYTDNDRCGFSCDFSKELSFDDYINYVLDVPMIFISKEEPIPINGKINFREYMVGGYREYLPNIEDYLLQANLCFPEVRLRNFVEIRNHDCGNIDTLMSILAIYKGILYDSSAMEDIEILFKDASFSEISELRYSVPKSALNSKFKRLSILDYSKEILSIARCGLKRQNCGEEKFLAYSETLISEGMSPADIILKNWYGSWNKDINKLINYIS